jgi:hypothetical protein
MGLLCAPAGDKGEEVFIVVRRLPTVRLLLWTRPLKPFGVRLIGEDKQDIHNMVRGTNLA